MPNIGAPELIIILVIALLVLGPGKLPEVGKSIGASIKEFRKASSDVQESMSLDPAQAAPAAAPAAAAVAAPVAAAPPPPPEAAPVAVAEPVATPVAAPVAAPEAVAVSPAEAPAAPTEPASE